MREIKFTTQYEEVLYFSDKEFKVKYEEAINDNSDCYIQRINGEEKHLAVCPKCNNPVVILGIYKKIDKAPHARHAKGVDIPGIAFYDEYKYLHCPYHIKNADYVKEYVPETEEPDRHRLYKIAKENFDKAIYLLQKQTGIYINLNLAEELAKNYASMRAYNYIDANVYNIPWYLIYSFHGLRLYHMLIKIDSVIYKQLVSLGFTLNKSSRAGYVYVASHKDYSITATNYRYVVGKDDTLTEYLDFSVTKPNKNVTDALLHEKVKRFSVKVDSYYFGNLVNYKKWKPNKMLLDIADKYMNP